MDNFYEQLVGTKKKFTYNLANAGTYVLGVLGLLMLGSGVWIPGLICIGLAVGSFFLKKNLYVEYEYVFTNGQIDIDKIMEMQSRKKVIEFDVKDAELIAPENSDYVRDFSGKPETVIDCTTNLSDKIFVAMVTKIAKPVQIRFSPSEELVDLFFKYNPRATKKY